MPHTMEDLIAASVGQRPMDFERSFNAIMMDKAAAAVEAQKAHMAKGMFNVRYDEEVEEVDEADIWGGPAQGGDKPAPKSTAGVQGSPGTQSGGGSIVKGRTGEADVYREGGKGGKKKKIKEAEEVEERFGGKGSDPSLRNNPPQGKPSGATPTPPSKGTGKTDLMTSLNAVRKTSAECGKK